MPVPIFVNLCQHLKDQAISSFLSGENPDLQILQSDSLRGFWLVYQETGFFQIWDLSRNIARTLIKEQIQENLMTRFFNKF